MIRKRWNNNKKDSTEIRNMNVKFQCRSTRALREHRPPRRQLIILYNTPILPGFAFWRVSMVSDHSQNLIHVSLYHCRNILNNSSKSPHDLLSNGRITDWSTCMHTELSGCITTLTVRNTWRLQTFVLHLHLDRSRWPAW